MSLLNTSPLFDEPMDGAIDNLRIWSKARSQAEICAEQGFTASSTARKGHDRPPNDAF
jgi:hypothetical protein